MVVGIVFNIYTIKKQELFSPGKELKEGKIWGKNYKEINVNIFKGHLCGSTSKGTCPQSWQPESHIWDSHREKQMHISCPLASAFKHIHAQHTK